MRATLTVNGLIPGQRFFNPFLTNVLILNTLETAENFKDFWESWAVKKGSICQKMVNGRPCHEIFLTVHKCKIWRFGCSIWKLELNVKLIALLTLPMFSAVFKTLNQLLSECIYLCSRSLTDFDAYFKELIHCYKLQ